ncbi:ABC transporter permease [Chitinophaga rhizophila]|uniref:DUF3526 domain-containing protein n=1 Tax=Chitinophaga rhizophila TaxID=2866212 RepID=A0ABS7G676_9BACT|nr:DUF3526 domain-containing protein [Chitinophaga rhizophila]MBW8682956.1 DUF3526 domain-containing protein [Chitinophaga rhizophila]
MLLLLTTKEWLAGIRTYALPAALLTLLLLIGIAFAGTYKRAESLRQSRVEANAHFRQQWEQLQTGDPHSAAHFGTYIFKPITLLSGFDGGLESVTGTSMRVEAHVQHAMAAPPARAADAYLRFGALTPASVLQLFFPLLIIFSCYNAYLQEKHAGTLKLLLIQGATHRTIISSKTRYYLAVVNVMLIAGLLVCIPALLFTGTPASDEALPLRLMILVLAYSSYCSIFVLITMVISVIAANARQALILLSGIWLIWNIIIPRLGPGLAARIYPLPSQYLVQEQIEKGIKMGIDGQTPREERQQQVIAATLKQYQVTSIDALPVNMNALLMQAGEDYSQRVYEHYTAKTDSIIDLQNRFTGYFALADPYLAVNSLSMALCGTDYLQQKHFDHTARTYRNDFIRRLNHELAYGGSRTGDEHWKVSASFYKSIPVFRYIPVSLSAVLRSQAWMIASLLLWLTTGIVLLQIIARYVTTE